MFTVPDTNDAVATPPAFSPVGPKPQGFFADCNPGANFPGTRPIAEHFNELILNLHALLTEAGVAPLKGDPTMLWRAVIGARIITDARTLHVATNGSATPANPWGGDAFASLAQALAYLDRYRIAASGAVTIQIAAGTYTATAQINVQHVDGGRLTIMGATAASTVLQFTGCPGLYITSSGTLGMLQDVTIRGDAVTTNSDGIFVSGGRLTLERVVLDNWADNAIVCERALVNVNPGGLTVTTHATAGPQLLIMASIFVANGPITMTRPDAATPCVQVEWGGNFRSTNTLTTGGGSEALVLAYAATAEITQMSVDRNVRVTNGATLAQFNAPNNGWQFLSGASLYAGQNGYVAANLALPTGVVTSPARNTAGNQNGYIASAQ